MFVRTRFPTFKFEEKGPRPTPEGSKVKAHKVWTEGVHVNQSLPIHTFETTKPVCDYTNIPPAVLESNKTYLVASYQNTKKPPTLTLVGICRGSMLKNGAKAKDLSVNLEDLPEQEQEQQPERMDIVVVIPDFFFFKGKPESLPETISSEALIMDLEKFWNWFRAVSWTAGLATPPETTLSPDFLFFVILMAVFQEPESLVGSYSRYLEHQFMYAIPDAKTRTLFAERHGLVISGPEEVEQKLLATVRIEAGKLRDDENNWANRVPTRLNKILELVSKWLWTPGSKRRMIC